MELVWPATKYLAGYTDALQRGWSPDTTRPQAAVEELERIRADPELFIAQQHDPKAEGPPVTLADGNVVPRIPGYRRWLWDGEFCGIIGFRWLPGTTDLPRHVQGHIGYSVVPWKRGRGYATDALRQLLADIDEPGLDYVDLAAPVDNHASHRVIEKNGGVLINRFAIPGVHGGEESLLFRIRLDRSTS
jgi:predicted acetyltransferase